MPATPGPSSNPSKKAVIIGWILGILPMPLFGMSAYLKFTPQIAETFQKEGWPAGVAIPLGMVEAACCIIYLIPRTAVLGAILLTGYLGGAIATHVHAGQAFWIPALFGILLWLGLYFRDPRLRVLVPLRRL